MTEQMEQICFQIISCSGTAKSMYVEAIQKAKQNDFDGAKALMDEAETVFVDAHRVHATLIQDEASGKATEFSLLLMHAEDQMASCETVKLLAQEIIELYQK